MSSWTDYRGGIHDNQCNEIQPGTLGYQLCQLPTGHTGKHLSQDGRYFGKQPSAAVRTLDALALNDVATAYAYDDMTHDPACSSVRVAYRSFIDETLTQWRAMLDSQAVNRLYFHGGDHDYLDSASMHRDLDAGVLWTRLSAADDLPDSHPLARYVSVESTLSWRSDSVRSSGPRVDLMDTLQLNDIFRAVHDFYGHYGHPWSPHFSFGPNGERSAWLRHRSLYSDAALPALWCETRGQSAWVNDFDNHRSLALPDRPFPTQKAGMPPLAYV